MLETDTKDLQTVAQYAKRKRKVTREDIYYYINIGRLKAIKIGGVYFIHKDEKIIPKKKKVIKKNPTKTEKRILNSKKYLSKIKANKNN